MWSCNTAGRAFFEGFRRPKTTQRDGSNTGPGTCALREVTSEEALEQVAKQVTLGSPRNKYHQIPKSPSVKFD